MNVRGTPPQGRRREDDTVADRTSDIAAVALETLVSQRGRAQPSPSGDSSECEALEQFCKAFQSERNFSTQQCSQQFIKLLHLLKTQRITTQWLLGTDREEGEGSCDHTHTILMTLRLLLRDGSLQHKFVKDPSPIPVLTQCLSYYTQRYFSAGNESSTTDILKELTNVFQKLSNVSSRRDALVKEGCHHLLLQLLSARDIMVLQCSLCALINICKSPAACSVVCKLGCVPVLVAIMAHPTASSRQLASDLFLLLSQSVSTHQWIKDTDALPSCLRLLHSDDLHVLHRMVSSLERMAEDSELQELIRTLGGVPLLLSILRHSRKGYCGEGDEDATVEKILALKAACCSTITQLVISDSNAQSIVQGNGIFLLSSLILPTGEAADVRLCESLQKNALRALRYLFSLERNRQLFKRLFPPQLFAAFIDIGHYVRDLNAYTPLMHLINTLPNSGIAVIQANVDATNQNRAPIFSVGGYTVLELLGAGSFGSVYKVKKKSSDVFLAMKEIRASHPHLGVSVGDRGQSIGRLMNEVSIMKEQLHHPNVVHYHKCFQDGGHLYIVMELLEGAPLSEYFSSMQEKRLTFSEDRLWRIFTQLVLALRYIHKEKHIVHRDLSPANIMLGEGDKLTITDFGLAKLKHREFSVMKSVVGTMLYWCPELVQSEPYTEKADIWAAGCILYQLATLKPPFYSTNLLALAKKIVEVDYEAVSGDLYSPLVSSVIKRCLCADPGERPDSVELGSLFAGILMQQMDQLTLFNQSLEKRVSKERQKTIKHMHRAVRSEQRYQKLVSSESSSRDQGLTVRRKLAASFSASLQDPSGDDHAFPLGHRDSLATSSDSLELVVEEGPQSILAWEQDDGNPYHSDLKQSQEGDARESCTETEEVEGSVNSDTDPLLKSSDSVFMESIHEMNRPQYVYSSPSARAPELPTDATPPMPVRRNPLTSRIHVNGSSSQYHGRSHSAVATSHSGGVDVGALRFGQRAVVGSLQSRSQSAYVGGIGRSSPNSGPLSPLAHKSRTASASSALSISPRHLREISDPISQLMTQMHKLLFLDQLPPFPVPCMRRLLLDRYKRALFDGSLPPEELKTEMHRLMSGASEVVQVVSAGTEEFGYQPRTIEKAMLELAESRPQELVNLSRGGMDYHSITYEQMQAIIESLLMKNGYYQKHSSLKA